MLGPIEPGPRVPHVASAVSPAFLERHAAVLRDIGRRWGAEVASSLAAHLEASHGGTEPFRGADVLNLSMRTFGPLAWVEQLNRWIRTPRPTCWFVEDGAWQVRRAEEGLAGAIRASADACLADPLATLGALEAATHARALFDAPAAAKAAPEAEPSVHALAGPPVVEGRTIRALVSCDGCLGPLTLDVDAGEATLQVLHGTPSAPTYAR